MNLQILRNEFDAGEGSFLITIRPNMIWNTEAFDRLSDAMEQYCREVPGSSNTLERWIATGFWFVPSFVRDWTSHPSFPRIYPADYYDGAYRRLDDLAYWYFTGGSPRLLGNGFDKLRP